MAAVGNAGLGPEYAKKAAAKRAAVAKSKVEKGNKAYWKSYGSSMISKSIPMARARGAAAEASAIKAANTADAQGNLSKANYNAMERGYAERDKAYRMSRDLQRLSGQMSGPMETNINKPSPSVQKMLKKKK